MFSKLFHKDLFFPDGVQEKVESFQRYLTSFEFTKHLLDRLASEEKDRSHNYNEETILKCLNTLKTNPQETFEVEVSKDFYYFGKPGWFITKFCVRIPIEGCNEILAVSIRPIYDTAIKKYTNSCKVVTAWINAGSDHHSTLDKSKYCDSTTWYQCK